MKTVAKIAAKVLALTMAVSAGSIANAGSVSGTTDFQVKIPEILVLYHWDTAVLEFKDLAQAVNDGSTQAKTNALVSSTSHIINNADVITTSLPTGTTSTGSGLSDVNVKLKNAWAVRSLAAGNVTLGLTTQNDTLVLDGTDTSSEVVIKTGASVSQTSIPSGWAPVKGDIDFTLDLSGVTKAGTHKTAATSADTTDVFKLTLSGS